MKISQPEWTVKEKIPFIWVIDDFNTALAAAYRSNVRLFDPEQGIGRLRRLVDETKASLSINFIIVPEYTRAGLPQLGELEMPMNDPAMGPYHRELQEWLAKLGDRAEVTVHGWTHRMDSYKPEIEINPGGWEYTRRSEWLYNPDPVANYKRCLDALTGLGYRPIEHVFSNCGGRMDRDTLRRLRKSRFGVLAKFPTQPEACRADYPEVPEMPWYLEDVDAFIFGVQGVKAEFKCPPDSRKPIFLVNHGYEFYERWYKEIGKFIARFSQFVQEYADDIRFVRYGDYVKAIHERCIASSRPK